MRRPGVLEESVAAADGARGQGGDRLPRQLTAGRRGTSDQRHPNPFGAFLSLAATLICYNRLTK
jgi:hypothetical protein